MVSNITTPSQGVSSLHQSLRYFPGKGQSKFCYELPATNGTTYLVRTTFRYGIYDGGSILKPTSFQLQIDTSNVALIKPDNSSIWESVIEVTMSAVAPQIYVCLAPTNPGTDVPFINAIELRELGPLMYPKARQGYMMITRYRYNFGSDHDLRHPDDKYDRLWRKYPRSNAPLSRLVSAPRGQNVAVETPYSRDEAPAAVMNTALTWPVNFIFPFNVTGGRNYVVLLWFAEMELTAQVQSRVFEVGIDENWQAPAIDILNVTKRIMYEAYEWGYGSIALSGTSTIAFRATTGSLLGPILNAMEVYEVSDPVQPRTDMQDVAAINAIKLYWPNLKTWTGDPCLALPYDWTSCSVDTDPRITMLKLDGYNLTGSIPTTTILKLPELTVLSLGNNSLNESVVPDLSALKQLQQLHLQNNNFSGVFPAWVTNLPNLQELFVEGNNFTGYVPQSLFNKTKYKFTYTPSDRLCTGSSPGNCTTTLGTPPVMPASSSMSSSTKMAIIIGTATGVLGLMLIGLIVCLWRCKRKLLHYSNSVSSRQLLKADPEAAFASSAKSQTMAYSFKEVKEATNNFQIQISEGSFGPVYKGKLSDGREVAVKRCRPCNKQGAIEFFDEVQTLARIHHRNLAALIGFCKDAQEQILLYEYLSNSDLWTHLHGDSGKHLPWSTRLSIALDVASAIEYLHTDCNPSIIHRDVQPRNILLTRNMTAKLVDFAFAKFTSEQDPTLQVYSVDVKGTAGYLDPEYAVSHHLSDKSDVYSFGVVLLELISGQEPIDKTASDRNPLLIEWTRPLLAEDDIKAVVDPSLGDKYNEDCMWKVAELGMMCVEPRPFNRPTMAEVVQELREAITLEGIAHPSLMTPLSPRSAQSSGPL
ncbi:hypothetical protein KC19_9G061400 [Ceratodon purpureus]|nr:hypothetical protein KC19_9G061400 [Ceratodon purpureus]